jgi:general nucleoside transport system permease protein
MEFVINVLFSTLRVSAPLILAAMAGALSKQVNLLNIALEGLMLFGAFAGIVFAAQFENTWMGLLAAMLLALVLSAIFALFVIDLHVNLIVAGLAINILALGLTAYLLTVVFNTRGAFMPDNVIPLPIWDIPYLKDVPIIGRILSGHGVLVYFSWLMVLVTSLILYKTPFGIHLRAVGEHKEAAQTAGIAVRRVEYQTILLGGILAGLAGAQLSIGDLTLFTDNMTNGRGFIALAAVFFGNAAPGLTAIGCLLFGMFEALQFRVQVRTGFSPQLLQMLPYLIVVIILVVISARKKLRSQIS